MKMREIRPKMRPNKREKILCIVKKRENWMKMREMEKRPILTVFSSIFQALFHRTLYKKPL